MKEVTIRFKGSGAEKSAKEFYHWVVDGGLEDSIIDTLSDDQTEVDGISSFDNDLLEVTFSSKMLL